MAKYNVDYKCGHEGVIELFGKHTSREWKLEKEKERICRDCYKSKIAEKNSKIPLIFKISHSSEFITVITATGSSYEVKENLKALGFRWGYSSFEEKNCWKKSIDIEILEEDIKFLKEEFKSHPQGIKIINRVNSFGSETIKNLNEVFQDE